MRLNDAARELIGDGADATLVTLNPDGSPHVTLVWVALQSTPEGDELVTAHLSEHKKVRNVRRDALSSANACAPPGTMVSGDTPRRRRAADGSAASP